MYEYKYIYSRYEYLYKCVQCEKACCVNMRIAAKAKLWFNLRQHICFKCVDTTKFYASVCSPFHSLHFFLKFKLYFIVS